ncbi:[histone H3]-lysine(4) N-trimethyltransferase [Ranunculus cassubicifolius]
MSSIVWTLTVLNDQIKRKKPALIFLSETLATEENSVEFVHRLHGLWNSHIVPVDGRSAGLLFLWDSSVSVELLYSCKWLVHAKVTEKGSGLSWCFSGVYLPTYLPLRKVQFLLLLSLKPANDLPWVCAGDFNNITSLSEKWGGVDVTQYCTTAFNKFINDAQLLDMGFVGSKFTWCNNQEGRSRVYTRIDRVLGTASWPYNVS